MKYRFMFRGLLASAFFLALVPTALASNTWYVDGVNGQDYNNCSSPQTACKTIGHAISLASSGDSIMVAAATYTENLTIGISLKILGANGSTTIVDGGGKASVFTISNSSANVTLSQLTIRNGSAHYGAGIANSSTLTINNTTISGNGATCNQKCDAWGGGISNVGTLTINSSTISGNFLPLNGFDVGGGIYNAGTLTINSSTISGNHTGQAYGYGGGVANDGTLTINNSTVSGNNVYGALSDGGGVLNGVFNNQSALAINNSTISGNSAPIGAGGGIANGGVATLQNSILANSSSGGDCFGSVTSNGYNLSSDNTCSFSGPGDMNNTDPMLGALGNYGGPTQTIPLLSGSPAIDAGNPSGCTDGNGHLLTTDQRGQPRPDPEDTGGCDMGAYESQSD